MPRADAAMRLALWAGATPKPHEGAPRGAIGWSIVASENDVTCLGMTDYLDLAMLDAGSAGAVAFARTGPHFATERVKCAGNLEVLLAFRNRIDMALRGETKRPSTDELGDFGAKLFQTLLAGSVRELFDEVSRKGDVRVHLVSNHPKIQSLPWEFFQGPNRVPGPHRDLSVARVHLGRCKPTPALLAAGRPVRVVLAYAEPRGQTPIPWPEVEQKMKDTFQARLPRGVTMDVVRAARKTDLHDAVSDPSNPCHVLHFLGHGEVRKGQGYLLLTDGDLAAGELSQVLEACGIRMVILSACNTASGNFQSNFSVTAQTLLSEGIPVVLANQLPIPASSIAPFVGTFYKHLIADGGIDRAVAEARITLQLVLETTTGEANIEWGIPTLYRNISSERFFGP